MPLGRVRPIGTGVQPPEPFTRGAIAHVAGDRGSTRAAVHCAAMEDRITPALYLEMTDRDIDDYVEDRVPAVLAGAGVTRATWWRNVFRDRPDLPRRLPEFDHLAVYEVDERFSTPAIPDDVRGHHFRHSPRPGQGRLTGRPTIGLSLVLISPAREEDAQALRDWADFVHIRFIAEVSVPGYAMITPYENARAGSTPMFMHCYEIDQDDPEAVFKSMTPLVTKLFGSDDTAEWQHWATTPELRIDYVNTFRLLGARERVDR